MGFRAGGKTGLALSLPKEGGTETGPKKVPKRAADGTLRAPREALVQLYANAVGAQATCLAAAAKPSKRMVPPMVT